MMAAILNWASFSLTANPSPIHQPLPYPSPTLLLANPSLAANLFPYPPTPSLHTATSHLDAKFSLRRQILPLAANQEQIHFC